MSSAPSFQFYPGDWLRNDVSGCSLEAQGLWLRMMIIMHDAQIYGQLVLNNAPMSPEFIAKKIGISPKKYANLLQELDFAGVINRRENGVIFSGRMERDERARQQNRDRQKNFRDTDSDDSNANSNGDVTLLSRSSNGKSNANVTAMSQPSSSSSSVFPFSFPLSEIDLKRLIDEAVAKNSKKDARLVEIAVTETLMNRNGDKTPINSLGYFGPEIKRMCSKSNGLAATTVDVVLRRRREQIAAAIKGNS